jgi:hypothetical protein
MAYREGYHAPIDASGLDPAEKPGCAVAGQWLNRRDIGNQQVMRAETEKLVEDIKRSIGLLRRHL